MPEYFNIESSFILQMNLSIFLRFSYAELLKKKVWVKTFHLI